MDSAWRSVALDMAKMSKKIQQLKNFITKVLKTQLKTLQHSLFVNNSCVSNKPHGNSSIRGYCVDDSSVAYHSFWRGSTLDEFGVTWRFWELLSKVNNGWNYSLVISNWKTEKSTHLLWGKHTNSIAIFFDCNTHFGKNSLSLKSNLFRSFQFFFPGLI